MDLIQTDISDSVAHDLYAELYRDQVFSDKELGTAIKTYHKPELQVKEIDGLCNEPRYRGTAWGMYNAASHAIKGGNTQRHGVQSRGIEKTTKEFFDWEY